MMVPCTVFVRWSCPSVAAPTTSSGDILVIEAGEIHSFRNAGDAALVQLDVHMSPTSIQENLG